VLQGTAGDQLGERSSYAFARPNDIVAKAHPATRKA
jgi:hypothetical protein